MSISTTIKSIQDIMRKDVGVDGDAQLVWMFFLKIYDNKETEYELLDDAHRSAIVAKVDELMALCATASRPTSPNPAPGRHALPPP